MAPGEGEGGGMQGEGMDSVHLTQECSMPRFVMFGCCMNSIFLYPIVDKKLILS